MATQRDLYAVLGVGEKATSDEIKRAYRKLAKQYHPDANRGDERAAERFKEISEAYSVLHDEEKRRKYDQMRRAGSFAGFGGAPGGRGRPAGSAAGFETTEDSSFTFDQFEFGGLGDLFGSIFDRTRRRERAGAAPQRGNNIEVVVDVPFTTAARGGKVAVSVPVSEPCATCGGSGARPGSTPSRCPECRGSGTVSFGQGGFAVTRPCPACYGRGTIATDPCQSCSGNGMKRRTKRIHLTVPAGVESGAKSRLSGQGEPDPSGGRPGDLLVTYRVKPDRFFRRDGLDIHCTVPINVAQAMLGSKVRVRTVDGSSVVLRIPPGTQSNTKFRVRGKGVEKNGQRGDQLVQVRIRVPEQLDERAEELVKELARAAELKY